MSRALSGEVRALTALVSMPWTGRGCTGPRGPVPSSCGSFTVGVCERENKPREAPASTCEKAHPVGGWSPGQGGAEPRLVHPPEVVLAPVDERHRHLLAEPVGQRRVVVDRDLVVRLPQLGADAGDDGARVVAEVAARAAVEGDAGAHPTAPVTPAGRANGVARARAAGPSAPCR